MLDRIVKGWVYGGFLAGLLILTIGYVATNRRRARAIADIRPR